MAKESKNKEKKVKKRNHFLKNTKAELKKVIWPNFKQLSNNTIAVITIVIIIGLIVFLLDLGFEVLSSLGIERLKSAVGSSNTISQGDGESSVDVNEIVSEIQANIDAQQAEGLTVEPETEVSEEAESNLGE